MISEPRESGGAARTCSLAHSFTASVCGFRYEEALHEVDALLPVGERVLGAEHPDTTKTQSLRAQILGDMGQHD